jgi:ribosomal protein L11 methyltransferase
MFRAKALWSVSLRVASESEDAVAVLLAEVLGNQTAVYTDFETGFSTITVYLTRPPVKASHWRGEILAGLQQIRRAGLRPGRPKLRLVRIRRENWANSWKRHFAPFQVGDALLVRPSWSRRRPQKGQGVLVLDPGLSFGTGQHPTTAFCLEQVIAARDSGADSLLDIGTGSGILALAAARIGYSRVDGFDLDPVAVRVSRSNAKRNGLARNVRLMRGDLARLPQNPRYRYDVICANLVANLLFVWRDRVVRRLKPGGRLVLAGILTKEFESIRHAYGAAGLRLTKSRRVGEWRSGTFRSAS